MPSMPEHCVARVLAFILLIVSLAVPAGSDVVQLEHRSAILRPPAKGSPMCVSSNVQVMQLRQLNHILAAHNVAVPSKDLALRNRSIEVQAARTSGEKEGNKWKWRNFESAKELVQRQAFSKRSEFWSWKERPADIPYNPNHTYKLRGWSGWTDFLRGQEGDLMSDEQRRSCDVCRHSVAAYGEVSVDLRYWSKFLCHQCALAELAHKQQLADTDQAHPRPPLAESREQNPLSSRHPSPSLSSWSADSDPFSSPSDALPDPCSDSPSSSSSSSSPLPPSSSRRTPSSPACRALFCSLRRSPSPSVSSHPDPLDASPLPLSSPPALSSSTWAPKPSLPPSSSLSPTPRTSPDRQLRRASRQPLRAAAIVRLVRRCRDCPQLACFGPPLNLKSGARPGRGRVGQRAVHCRRHAGAGEVDVVHVTKCRAVGCARTPSFGAVGGRAEFCKRHRQAGHEGLVGYRCRFPEGCGLRASFGDARTGIPSFCCRHKSATHIDLLSRRCRYPEGCTRQASFPATGEGDLRQFCRKHDREIPDLASPPLGVG